MVRVCVWACPAVLLCFVAGAAQQRPPATTATKPAWPTSSSARPVRFLASISGSGDVQKNAPADAAFRFQRPFGIAVDENQRIFVADPGLRSVLVLDRRSVSAVRWTGNAQFPLSGPVAVALAPDGRLFVADGYEPRIVVFDRGGKPVASFGNNALKRPGGVAVDARNGRIYVGDMRLNQVVAFDLQTFAVAWKIGETSEHFSAPAGLAVNSKGHLHVADRWTCAIQVFGPDGAFVRRFNTQCTHRGESERPPAIAIGRDDRIYVAMPDSDSMEIFDASGKPLQLAAGLGDRPTTVAVRTAVAIDGDARIYVVEQQNGTGQVRIFAQGGRALSTQGRRP